jgi:hypothetical protein
MVSPIVPAEATAQHKLLLDHINALRELPPLSNAQIVLGIECNLGFEAQHAVHTLQRAHLRRWLALSEGPQGTVGLLTTNQSKEIMTVAVQELLAGNRLYQYRDMVCLSNTRAEMFRLLSHEMRRFMILVEPPKNVFGKPRKTYSGKVGGQNDDVCIALQLAVLSLQIFMRDDKYTGFHM